MADAGADRTPLDQALDVFVYAPIGLLLDGHAVVRDLAARGRDHAVGARMVGQFALAQGQREIERLTGRLADQVGSLLGGWGGAAPDAEEGASGDAGGPGGHEPGAPAAGGPHATAALARAADEGPSRTGPSRTGPSRTGPSPAAPSPDVATLAIPDYDGLSASQVVNRLPGLEPAELHAVRDYEATHRARKTILTKIARLDGA